MKCWSPCFVKRAHILWNFFFYFNTSSLPKTILLAVWVSALKVNKSFNFFVWWFFKAVFVFPRLCERSQFLTCFLYFIPIPFKTFSTLLPDLFLKHKMIMQLVILIKTFWQLPIAFSIKWTFLSLVHKAPPNLTQPTSLVL